MSTPVRKSKGQLTFVFCAELLAGAEDLVCEGKGSWNWFVLEILSTAFPTACLSPCIDNHKFHENIHL